MPEEMMGQAGERIELEEEDEVVKKLVDPKLPSAEQVEMHYLMGHTEYRNWCEVCVKARGKEMDHRTEEKDRRKPEYNLDYCFPGDELGFKWTVLVGKERGTGLWMGTAVPMKGS